MSTELSIWLGIGYQNKGDITANNYASSMEAEVGDISGTSGFERVKLANSIVELGELPDIDALISKRHQELVEAEMQRHEERLTEINKINAA